MASPNRSARGTSTSGSVSNTGINSGGSFSGLLVTHPPKSSKATAPQSCLHSLFTVPVSAKTRNAQRIHEEMASCTSFLVRASATLHVLQLERALSTLIVGTERGSLDESASHRLSRWGEELAKTRLQVDEAFEVTALCTSSVFLHLTHTPPALLDDDGLLEA